MTFIARCARCHESMNSGHQCVFGWGFQALKEAPTKGDFWKTTTATIMRALLDVFRWDGIKYSIASMTVSAKILENDQAARRASDRIQKLWSERVVRRL